MVGLFIEFYCSVLCLWWFLACDLTAFLLCFGGMEWRDDDVSHAGCVGRKEGR